MTFLHEYRIRRKMNLKGYFDLSIVRQHPDGGTIIHHPDVGEIRVKYLNYNAKTDLWTVKKWDGAAQLKSLIEQ